MESMDNIEKDSFEDGKVAATTESAPDQAPHPPQMTQVLKIDAYGCLRLRTVDHPIVYPGTSDASGLHGGRVFEP